MTPTIKTSLVSCTVVAILLILVSFTYQQEEANAITEKEDGIDVYIYCKPSRKYRVVKDGTILTVTMKGIDGVVNAGVRRAKDAEADGIIINARNSKYKAIKYE